MLLLLGKLLKAERVKNITRRYGYGDVSFLGAFVGLEVKDQFVSLNLGAKLFAIQLVDIFAIPLYVLSVYLYVREPETRVVSADNGKSASATGNIIYAIFCIGYGCHHLPFHGIPFSDF